MSYVLINGKRYYKDDRTGRTTLDNVSQVEADRRAQRKQGIGGAAASGHPGIGNRRTTSGSGNSVARTGVYWKPIIICSVIALFVGAFLYNRYHVSSAEEAIKNYMNAQEADSAFNTPAVEAAAMEDNQETNTDEGQTTYLMPDSAERYLEDSDIENCSHDEVQLIINEIYARHGREFHSQTNIDYFGAQDWYEPIYGKSDEEIVSEFNEFEKANVDMLSKFL